MMFGSGYQTLFFFTGVVKFASRIYWFLTESIPASMREMLPSPLAATEAQSMMDSHLYVTVEMFFFKFNFVPFKDTDPFQHPQDLFSACIKLV